MSTNKIEQFIDSREVAEMADILKRKLYFV